MKKIFEKNNKSVLYKLCMSFVLILAVPLMTWMFLYSQMENIIMENTIKYNNAVVSSSIKNMQDITNQINYNNTQMSLSRDLKKIINYNLTLDSDKLYEMGQLSKELRTRMVSYPVVNEMYVYFPNIDYCVYSSGNMSSKDFYSIHYGGSEEDYEKWKAELTQDFYFRQKNETALDGTYVSFIQPLPLGIKNIEAVCVSMVEEKKFLNAFYNEEKANNQALFVVKDNRGNVIMRGGNEELFSVDVSKVKTTGKTVINGEEYYILQTKISMPSWNVISVISMSSIRANLNSVRIWSIILLFVYLIICISIFVSLLKYNYTPIKNILNRIASTMGTVFDGKTNEYMLIEQAFREISSQKQALDNLLEDKEDVIKQNFLNSLLKGNLKPEELEKTLHELGIKPFGDKFLVVLCQIEEIGNVFPDDDGLNNRERLRLGNFIIDSILSEIFANSLHVMSTTINDMTAYIINTSSEARIYESVRHYILEAQKAVVNYFDFLFVATVSDMHDTYIGICEGYEEALQSMEYRILYNEGAIIKYSDVKIQKTGNYYYPLENEKILINHIKNGDYEAAKRVMDEIYDINFKCNNPPVTFVRCLMFDMASTILKTMNELSANFNESIKSEDINDLLNCENIYDMQKMMHKILCEVCDYVNSKSNVRFQNKVIDFIEKNYSNSQLTVSMIADYMGLNPTYISNVFSDKMGIRLLDYIMRYRVNKAKELFDSCDGSTVDDVARQVGYDSRHTFVRIFKKYEGITPTQYIKSNNSKFN